MLKNSALFLSILSFVLLIPGLNQPILSLVVGGQIQASGLVNFSFPGVPQTRSILDTIEHLWRSERMLVASLIFIFSVLIPVLKGLIILIGLLLVKNLDLANKLQKIISVISKWSMCDVFIVSIFLVFLTTGQKPQVSSHHLNIMGMAIDIGVGIQITSQLGSGFYYFLAYCLTSILSSQLFAWSVSQEVRR